jgi:hypothetical protein
VYKRRTVESEAVTLHLAMRPSGYLVFTLTVIIGSSGVYAAHIPPGVPPEHEIGCTNPDLPRSPPTSVHWVKVQSETIRLDKPDAQPLTITLWHSREAVACDGAGNSVEAIRLLVRASGRELYRYDPGANEGNFRKENLWMGGRFNVQDVIGDGVPQVIFVSGLGSATGALFHLHIIRLDPPDHVIRDVAPSDFQYGSRRSRLRSIGPAGR